MNTYSCSAQSLLALSFIAAPPALDTWDVHFTSVMCALYITLYKVAPFPQHMWWSVNRIEREEETNESWVCVLVSLFLAE